MLPWLGVNENEDVIRNLSRTLEDNEESVANGIAVLQRSLASLAKVVLAIRIALIFYLNKEVSVLRPTPPAVPELVCLGKNSVT